ncbi:MAG: class I SAM-dependent methyltransferase [Patescibacteria group bacterium]
MNCRVCDVQLIPFLSLGQMPLANAFAKAEELPLEKKYDISVGFCPQCFLVQLFSVVPGPELFKSYLYFSSISQSFLEHCKHTALYVRERFRLTPQSFVLEIGSNDGAFLQYLKELEIPFVGIEPAKNIAKLANEKGMWTIPSFFTHEFARRFHEEQGMQADLVYGANVLAHVSEIVDFVQGVKVMLKPKGSAVFEFPYGAGLLEGKFDLIYHEHVFYYSLLSLQHLFSKADLEIYDVEFIPLQGGSLRIFAGHPGAHQITKNIEELAKRECKDGFDRVETYRAIEGKVRGLKSELLALLDQLKKEGKRIAAYSAPAKGMTLLNYCGIGENYLDFIVDKSPAKQGLYTPGTHMLIHPIEKISEDKPAYLLLLCWNLGDEVMGMEELRPFRESGGKFIIPIPSVRLV